MINKAQVLNSETLTTQVESWIPPNGERETGTYGPDYYVGWLGSRPVVLSVPHNDFSFTIFDITERNVLFSRNNMRPQNVLFSPTAEHMILVPNSGGMLEVYTPSTKGERIHTAKYPTGSGQLSPRLVPQLMHQPSDSGDAPIKGLALSADGQVLAMAGADNHISLWDRASGREFRRLSFGEPVKAIALSKDATQLLSVYEHRANTHSLWDVTNGERQEINIWDVTNGERQDIGLITGDTLVKFLNDGERVLSCSNEMCLIYSLDETDFGKVHLKLSLDFNESRFGPRAVSLAPDERSIAVVLGEGKVGRMELNAGGHRSVIKACDYGYVDDFLAKDVTAVAALSNGRVVAGCSDGSVLLFDLTQGIVLGVLLTRDTPIEAVILLDGERLAVVSRGHTYLGELVDRAPQMLLVSSKDLSVLGRMRLLQSKGVEDTEKKYFLSSIASSKDGRWMVSAFYELSNSDRHVVQVLDINMLDTAGILNSNFIPTVGVEFGGDGEFLLSRGEYISALWHIDSGHVSRQFRHTWGPGRSSRSVQLAGKTIVYQSHYDDVHFPSLMSWSPHSGLRNLGVFSRSEDISMDKLFSVDGLRIAWLNAGLEEAEVGLLSLGDERYGELLTNFHRDIDYQLSMGVYLDQRNDRILLDFKDSGLELVNALSGESLWVRDDIKTLDSASLVMFTVDRTAVIVTTEDGHLLVLDVTTGETLFDEISGDRDFISFPNENQVAVPIYSDAGVQGILRQTDYELVERLSIQDGSVVDTPNLRTNLGRIVRHGKLGFVKCDRDGDRCLVSSE